MLINFLKNKEALLILVLTVLCYISATSFEYGYAYYFGYPVEVIALDSKSLFVGLSYLFLNAIYVMLIFFTPWPSTKEKTIKLTSISWIIMIIFTIQAYRHHSQYLSFFIITLSIIITTTYVVFKIVKNYNKNTGYLIWTIITPTITIAIFSFFIGLQIASLKTDFNFFHDNETDYVILRVYDGNVVAKSVDINKKTLGEEVLYIPSYNPEPMKLNKITINK